MMVLSVVETLFVVQMMALLVKVMVLSVETMTLYVVDWSIVQGYVWVSSKNLVSYLCLFLFPMLCLAMIYVSGRICFFF